MRAAFCSGDLIGTLELTDSGRRDFLNPELLLDLTPIRHSQMDQHLPITELRHRMRFELQLLVTASFMNDYLVPRF